MLFPAVFLALHAPAAFAAPCGLLRLGDPVSGLPQVAVCPFAAAWPLSSGHVFCAVPVLLCLFAVIVFALAWSLLRRRNAEFVERERERLTGRLKAAIANERIINHCLQRITLESDFDSAANEMLDVIGRQTGSDRSYVFSCRDGRIGDVCEWTADGVGPRIGKLRGFDLSVFPSFRECLLQKKDFIVPDAEALASGDQVSYEFLKRHSIRSIFISAVYEGGTLWGFLGFEYVRTRRDFSESDVHMLKSAANLFSLAKERGRQLLAISDGSLLRRQLFDNIAIPIVMFDLDYNITMMNPEACRYQEMPKDKVLGAKCYDVLCKCGAPPQWCPAVRLKSDGKPHRIHFEGHGGRHFIVNAQPIFDRENRLVSVLENAMDVTDLYSQKRDGEVANLFLNRAGEIARITYFKGDAGGNISVIGGNLESGLPRPGEVGRFADWMEPEDRDGFEAAKSRLVSGSDEILEYVCHSRASGRLGSYYVCVTAYDRKEGVFLGIVQDITDSVEAENEKSELIKRQASYLENEKIVNRCMSQMISEEDFDANICSILEILATQTNSDRAYFGRYTRDMDDYYISHEWLAEGVSSLREIRDPRFKGQFMKWLDVFSANRLLEIPCIQSSEYAEVLREPGCRTLLCAPVFADGGLIGVIGLGYIRKEYDITEQNENMIRSVSNLVSLAWQRNQRKRELQVAIRDREAVFCNVSVPIMLFDHAGALCRVNPALCEIAGKSETEILASPFRPVFCGDSEPHDRRLAEEALKFGTPRSAEAKVGGRDYMISAEPVRDADGAICNVIETAIDITEINEGKRRIEEAMEAAQSANKAKSYFLATMSHELRTPLNAVIGFSELLQGADVSKKDLEDYLKSINFAGNALLGLINDVLDLSRIEANQMKIVPEPTDFGALLEEMRAIFRQRVAAKGIEMRLDCPGDLPSLFLDSLRLRQVLLNIMGNAVKFTDAGRISVRAAFRPHGARTGTLEVCVSDTGIGISPQFLKSIFDPFTRQDSIRGNHVYEGSGLGLAVSKRLISQMDGVLSVKSEPGVGSEFSIVLSGVEFAASPARDASPSGPFEIPESIRGLRILAVDDVPLNLKVLSSMLSRMNVECRTAVSGAEALRILKAETFDLVLSDMWMPEMNGMELAEAVRKLSGCGGLPVVAVTADTDACNSFDMSAFSAILLKPLTMRKVAEVLAGLRA